MVHVFPVEPALKPAHQRVELERGGFCRETRACVPRNMRNLLVGKHGEAMRTMTI